MQDTYAFDGNPFALRCDDPEPDPDPGDPPPDKPKDPPEGPGGD